MARRARFRGLSILLVLVLIGGAWGDVTERVTLYSGDAIEGTAGVTFDGERFTVPGRAPIPRSNVQKIEFQVKAARGERAAETGAVQGLTPLAQSQLAKTPQMAQAFPGVGGIILVDDGEFVYHEDGTNSYRYHFAGLVLKEEMKSWAQVTVGFSEGRSRSRLLFGRSISPDGTVHTLSPDDMKVGSPSEALSFFNPNRKVLSGVIPGVEVGSVVEYGYEFDYYSPEDPRLFSPGYYFQGTEPVAFSRVKVTVPKDTPFHYMTRHFPSENAAEPTTEQTGDNIAYTWQLEDMPPITPEPYMPPQNDLVPFMEASVFETHEDVFELLGGLQRARIRLTPEIRAQVDEIVEGADTVDEKIGRIYHWIQEYTRYISIKGSLGAGFSGHTAQETFENRYGDCTDKSVLFVTMLEGIGVEAYPIIVRTNDAGTAITEIPTLSGNHCITEVCLPDRSFYLDGTAQNYRYPYFRADDHGISAFNGIRGDIRMIPVPPPSDNRRFSHLDVALSPEGDAVVRTRNAYNGNIEAGVRGFWKRTREDNRKLMMAEYVNTISPGAVLDDFTLTELDDLAQPLEMTIDYTLHGHAIRVRDLMYLKLPTLERDFPEAALETRRYPIQYHTTEERILEIDLDFPPGFRARWLPPPLEIVNAYVEYQARYQETEGQVRFRGIYRRPERIVPVEDYPTYRDALRAIAAFTKQEIFLTEEGR